MIRVLKVLALVVLVAVLLTVPGQTQAGWHGGCGGCGWGCCDSWGLCGCGGWGSTWAYGWGGGCGGWCGYHGLGWGGCGCHHGCGYCGFGCPVVVASVPCCDMCGCGFGCGGCGCGSVGVVSGGCGCGGGSVIEGAPMAPMASPATPTPAPAGAVPVVPGHTLNSAHDSGTITIWVPEDAKVYVNGYLTKSTGNRRQFVSYGLKDGFNYKYEVRATVTREGKTLEETHSVALTAGSKSTVAFKFDSKDMNVASIW